MDPIWHPIVATILMCLVAVFWVWSGLSVLRMVDEINAQRPESQRIKDFSLSFRSARRLIREYKRECPAGRRTLQARLIFGVGLVCLALAVWLLII